MKNDILDEDLTIESPKDKEEVKNTMSEALAAVLVAAFIYFLFLMLDFKYFNIYNPVYKAFFNDSLSIIHLLMAMIYLNYKITNGDYKKNVKGGYYILLFGSGIFFIGASISLVEGMTNAFSREYSWIDFWNLNYQHIITLLVILIKLILIYPISLILMKTKKYVPTEK